MRTKYVFLFANSFLALSLGPLGCSRVLFNRAFWGTECFVPTVLYLSRHPVFWTIVLTLKLRFWEMIKLQPNGDDCPLPDPRDRNIETLKAKWAIARTLVVEGLLPDFQVEIKNCMLRWQRTGLRMSVTRLYRSAGIWAAVAYRGQARMWTRIPGGPRWLSVHTTVPPLAAINMELIAWPWGAQFSLLWYGHFILKNPFTLVFFLPGSHVLKVGLSVYIITHFPSSVIKNFLASQRVLDYRD